MAVKFNDYFEFPREFDLEPYTASGLAVKEGLKYIHVYTCTCMCMYMYLHTFVFNVHTCTCILYMYSVHTYMYIHICTYAHTHTHTYAHSYIFLHLFKPGEEIPDTDEKKEENEEQEEILDTNKSFTTKYRLRGIVVHSGQASGGHYYSFIHVK